MGVGQLVYPSGEWATSLPLRNSGIVSWTMVPVCPWFLLISSSPNRLDSTLPPRSVFARSGDMYRVGSWYSMVCVWQLGHLPLDSEDAVHGCWRALFAIISPR